MMVPEENVELPTVSRILHLSVKTVCKIFTRNPSTACWDILDWTIVMDHHTKHTLKTNLMIKHIRAHLIINIMNDLADEVTEALQ